MKIFRRTNRSEDGAKASGSAFIALFALDSLARSTLVTVVPLQALSLLEDPQKVSLLYFLVAAAGLTGSMLVPWLVRKIRHHRTLILGSTCMAISAIFLSQQSLFWFVPGLALQLFASATIVICLNLYVLRHVRRDEFSRFEPKRILFSGGAWVIGPALGVFLQEYVAIWVPYTAAAVFSLTQLAYFLCMRVDGREDEISSAGPHANPVRFIPRFFRQPRLVLAWMLSATRAGWWGLFYVFGPIFIVSNGLSAETSGIISSIGSAGMLSVMLWGWVGRRIGIRSLLILGFTIAGVMTLAAATTTGYPWVGAALLIIAALGTSIIDSGGNVPYLRAVRPRERSEMTTVYATYRDASRFTFPALYSLLLFVFPLPVVFVAGGGIMLVLSQCARKLPRSLGREKKRTQTAALPADL